MAHDAADVDLCEYLVRVEWIETLPRAAAMWTRECSPTGTRRRWTDGNTASVAGTTPHGGTAMTLARTTAGELTPAEAVAAGHVHLTGDPALVDRLAELFHIGPRPGSYSTGRENPS